MIAYKKGDIFSEDVDALVNSVNCVGVMGRGIALQFKQKFPANFRAYKKACERGEVKPGKMFVFDTDGRSASPRFIINFPTKRHWRSKSRIEDIETGLEFLADVIRARDIGSIAIPALGSDLGKLSWDDVRPRVEAALSGLTDVNVVVFEPGSVPADQRPNRSAAAPKMTRARAVLVSLIDRYLRGLLDPSATLLATHKMMYFMQESGEPLDLKFKKRHYGPYAENLRHVLRDVEGHLISGYADGGDDPAKELELVPGAVEDADAFLAYRPDTLNRLNQVADLMDGFESSFGLELLATVHWTAAENPSASDDEIADRVYAWHPRKRRFSDRHIRLALATLRDKDWMSAAPNPNEGDARDEDEAPTPPEQLELSADVIERDA